MLSVNCTSRSATTSGCSTTFVFTSITPGTSVQSSGGGCSANVRYSRLYRGFVPSATSLPMSRSRGATHRGTPSSGVNWRDNKFVCD